MKGKATVNYIGREGLVTPQTVPSWDFIYEASIIKHAKFEIGDRVVLPDGREFIYAKSSAACISGQGCEFTSTGAIGTSYPIATVAKGGKKVTLSEAAGTPAVLTHDPAYAKDVFRGGYVIFHDAAAGNADAQFRGIIGNDYSAVDAVLTIYLDGGLHKAVDSTTFTEIFDNPYAALRTGTSSALAKAGVPAVEVSAANMYFWVQISGPVWVAPQGEVISNQIGCYWRHDGSLQDGENAAAVATGDGNISTQYAGHTIEGNKDGIGPLFMLKG